jgi:hypothetical protein
VFQAALDSINAMEAIAERESHHPDFYLTNYRDCEIILYTHKLQGITENDLVLAEMLDKEVQVTYSPKWLKQHPVANTEKTETKNSLLEFLASIFSSQSRESRLQSSKCQYRGWGFYVRPTQLALDHAN